MSTSRSKDTVYDAPWLYQGNQGVTTGAALPQPRQWRIKRIIKRFFLLILIVALVVSGWLGWKFYQDTSKLNGNKNPLSWLGSLASSPLKETNGHVNILLAGYSADDAGHSGAELTDSIMIVSVDTTNKSAVVISVPRDLWVNVPGYGYSKINAAYQYGQATNFSADGYPSGGMGLLEQILTRDFGIQFGYYSLINYTAFKDAVNAVGGVNVNIQSANQYGLFDPNANLKLSNGPNNLDGQAALDLARARGAGYGSYGFVRGDFDRTTHQQQLLVALKDKASSASVIGNPLRISQLADALGKNIKTDLTVGEIQTLFNKSKAISDSNIKAITLNDVNGKDLLTSYYSYNGQSALIPADGVEDYSTIKQAVSDVLTPPTATSAIN